MKTTISVNIRKRRNCLWLSAEERAINDKKRNLSIRIYGVRWAGNYWFGSNVEWEIIRIKVLRIRWNYLSINLSSWIIYQYILLKLMKIINILVVTLLLFYHYYKSLKYWFKIHRYTLSFYSCFFFIYLRYKIVPIFIV